MRRVTWCPYFLVCGVSGSGSGQNCRTSGKLALLAGSLLARDQRQGARDRGRQARRLPLHVDPPSAPPTAAPPRPACPWRGYTRRRRRRGGSGGAAGRIWAVEWGGIPRPPADEQSLLQVLSEERGRTLHSASGAEAAHRISRPRGQRPQNYPSSNSQDDQCLSAVGAAKNANTSDRNEPRDNHRRRSGSAQVH